MKTIYFLFFNLFFLSATPAQYTIKGTITTTSGAPLIGATIYVKALEIGTISDYDGNYSLIVPAQEVRLLFSYVGFEEEIHTLMLKEEITTLDIEMKEATGAIVGCYFGPPRIESYSTSASSRIRQNSFPKGHYTDPMQLLRNQVPNFQINKIGNNPNENNTLRLRGIGDYYSGSAPLTVVDGIPGVPFSLLDFRDINAFEVARDEQAKAELGGAATNGLIKATTGFSSGKEMTYETYVTTETVAQLFPVASATDYTMLRNINNGATSNWQKTISRRAWSHGHRLSGNYAKNALQLNSSLHYQNAQGVALNSAVESIGGRISVEKEFLDSRLIVGTKLYLNHRKRNFGIQEAFQYALKYDPTAPIYDSAAAEFGGYFETQSPDQYNPLSVVEQNMRKGKQTDVMAKIYGQYMLNNSLDIKINAAKYQQNSLFGEFYAGTSNFYGRPFNGITEGVLAQNHLYYYDVGLYFEKYLTNDWHLNASSFLQQSFYQTATQISTAADVGSDLPELNDLATLLNIEELIIPLEKSVTTPASVNQFRLTYDAWWLIEGTIRAADWGKKGGFSGGIGTLIGLQKFIPIDLWLKGSYGYANRADFGRQRFVSNGTDYYKATFEPLPILEERLDGWQRNDGWNVGFENELLNGKLAFEAYYFNQKKEDMYLPLESITMLGIEHDLTRVGDVRLRNRGVEAAIKWSHYGNTWFWNSNLLFSKTQSKIEKISTGRGAGSAFAQANNPPLNNSDVFSFISTNPTNPIFFGEAISTINAGENLGQIIGYQTLGKANNGEWIIEDLDENGLIDENDKTVLGNGLPDFTLQLGQKIQYKEIALQFHLRGVFGHDILHTNRLFYERIHPDVTDNILQTSYYETQTGQNEFIYDYYVEDATHLVLDDITLTYEHRGAKTISFYLTAQDLMLFSNYSGNDPSPRYWGQATFANNLERNPWVLGLDYQNYYPRTWSLTLGGKLTL